MSRFLCFFNLLCKFFLKSWDNSYYPQIYLSNESTIARMQIQFLSGVKLVWAQSFSSRLIAVPRLKNQVCPGIYPWLEGEQIHTFPKGISMKWNTNNLLQNLYSSYHFLFPLCLCKSLLSLIPSNALLGEVGGCSTGPVGK